MVNLHFNFFFIKILQSFNGFLSCYLIFFLQFLYFSIVHNFIILHSSFESRSSDSVLLFLFLELVLIKRTLTLVRTFFLITFMFDAFLFCEFGRWFRLVEIEKETSLAVNVCHWYVVCLHVVVYINHLLGQVV